MAAMSDYLENTHGIKAAAGGAVMMAPAAGPAAAAAAVEPTEFDVVLNNAGANKLQVVKVVKNLTNASLMDAKKLVDGAPAKIKEKVSKEDASKFKAEIEKEGGVVEIKPVG